MRLLCVALLSVGLVAHAQTPADAILTDAPEGGHHPGSDQHEAHAPSDEADTGGSAGNDQKDASSAEQGGQDGTKLAEDMLEANREVAAATWWLVCWTAVLVFIGGLVGIGQLYLMRGSLRASREAVTNLERAWIVPEFGGDPTGIIAIDDALEEAAGKLAAQRFRRVSALARAIFKRGEPPIIEVNGPQDGPMGLVVEYKLANVGRSPARLTAIGCEFTYSPLPCPTNLPALELETERQDPLAPGKRRPQSAPHVAVVEDHERADMLAQEGAIRLRVVVVYEDVFGIRRETAFCWLFLRPSLRITEEGAGTGWDDSEWILLDGPGDYFWQT